jgi:membrane protease YdiL (CAAX protease family)
MLNFLKKEWPYILMVLSVCVLLLLGFFLNKPINRADNIATSVNLEQLKQIDTGVLLNLRTTRPLLFLNILLLLFVNVILIFGGGILLIVYFTIRLAYKDILPSSIFSEKKAPWNLWDIFKVIFFYIFILILITYAYEIISLASISKKIIQINFNFIAFLTGYLLIIGFIYYLLRQYGYTFRMIGLKYKNRWKDLFSGVAIYSGFYPVFFLISYLNQFFYKNQPIENDVFRLISSNGSLPSLCLLIIIICIIGPIIEEIFFRGFILRGLKRYMQAKYAVIFSSLIFAVLHLKIYIILPIAVLGLLLGYLRERTSSLTLPIIIHITHNSWVIFQAIIFSKLIPMIK